MVNKDHIEVMIEIPKGSKIKYEYDHENNKLICDRFLYTPVDYFFNYGYIPHTLSEDGDPTDVIVLCEPSIYPTAHIKCKPIGVLYTEDEDGIDPKIISVPINKVDPNSSKYNDIDDLEEHTKKKLRFFYENYKNLNPNKWIKVNGWGNREETLNIINESYRRHKEEIKSKL